MADTRTENDAVIELAHTAAFRDRGPVGGVEHLQDVVLPPEHVHSSVAEHDIIHITNIPLGIDRDFLPLDPLGPDPADSRLDRAPRCPRPC